MVFQGPQPPGHRSPCSAPVLPLFNRLPVVQSHDMSSHPNRWGRCLLSRFQVVWHRLWWSVSALPIDGRDVSSALYGGCGNL